MSEKNIPPRVVCRRLHRHLHRRRAGVGVGAGYGCGCVTEDIASDRFGHAALRGPRRPSVPEVMECEVVDPGIPAGPGEGRLDVRAIDPSLGVLEDETPTQLVPVECR